MNIELNVWYYVNPIRSKLRIHRPIRRDGKHYITDFIDHSIGKNIRQGSQEPSDFIRKLTQFELEFYNIKECSVINE